MATQCAKLVVSAGAHVAMATPKVPAKVEATRVSEQQAPYLER